MCFLTPTVQKLVPQLVYRIDLIFEVFPFSLSLFSISMLSVLCMNNVSPPPDGNSMYNTTAAVRICVRFYDLRVHEHKHFPIWCEIEQIIRKRPCNLHSPSMISLRAMEVDCLHDGDLVSKRNHFPATKTGITFNISAGLVILDRRSNSTHCGAPGIYALCNMQSCPFWKRNIKYLILSLDCTDNWSAGEMVSDLGPSLNDDGV